MGSLRIIVVVFFFSGVVYADSIMESVLKSSKSTEQNSTLFHGAKPEQEAKTESTAKPGTETKVEAETKPEPAEVHKTRSTSVFGKRENNASTAGSDGAKSYGVFGSRRVQKDVEVKEDGQSQKKYGKDNPRSAPKFLWPLEGGRISSFYGWRNSRRFHDGIDIIAKAGTTVYASKGGEIIYSGSRIRGYGNMIVIRGNEGMNTVYAHNKTNLVKKGSVVSQGDAIAYVGSTGHSSGSHLHFEIRKGKFTVDPLKYLSSSDVKAHSGTYKNTDVGIKESQAD